MLKNNPDFVQQIETLKTDLLSRVDEIKMICLQGYGMLEEYEENLEEYQQLRLLRAKFKEFLLTDLSHEFYWHVYSIFSYIPQVYFNSLKSLRHHWYNYETSVALE